MSFVCKDKCGVKSDYNWLFINNAWVPVITVCNQNLNKNTEVCQIDDKCVKFRGSTLLWDACFTNYIVKVDNNITGWVDLNNDFPIYPSDNGKEPGFTVSKNHNKNHNMITFNGTNQGLGCVNCFNGTTAFTAAVVVNNLAENLSENIGTIFSLISFPFTEQILLGYEGGNIVLKYNNETLTDLIPPVSVDNGFHLIVVRYTGIEGVGNVDLIIDGNTYTNESSFVFNNTVDTFYMGSTFADYSLNGEIGWLAYYDSAINDNELNYLIYQISNKFNIN